MTLDAMQCETTTARNVRAGGGDYVRAFKGNQPATHDAVETFFAEAVRAEWRVVAHDRLVTTDADLVVYLNPGGDT